MKKMLLAVILVLVAILLPGKALADNVPALQSDKFVDSVGVALHTSYGNFANWTGIKPVLTGLGMRHVRDGISSSTQGNPELMDLALNFGIKSTLVLDARNSNGVLDTTLIPGQITLLKSVITGYPSNHLYDAVEAIEGPNEYDVNHGSTDTNWSNTLGTFQKSMYQTIRGDSTFTGKLVLGPSMGTTNDIETLASINIGGTTMAEMVDVGNAHPYTQSFTGTPDPTTCNPGQPVVNTYLRDSQDVWPGIPLQTTETGYTTCNDSYGITEALQAKYVPRLALMNFRLGLQRAFYYDFLDEDADTDSSNPNHHFGLVHTDLTVKQSYTNLKNLLSLLADPGSSFTPTYLNYSLSGTTTYVQELLLEKRNKTFYLVLWAETPGAVSQSIKVTFNEQFFNNQVTKYTPDTSTTGTVVTLDSSNSTTFNITDEPVIFQVTPMVPSGTMLQDDLSDLSETHSFQNWEATTPSPSAVNWWGDNTVAQRTSDTTTDYITYAGATLTGFSAKIGFPANVGSPYSFTSGTFNFSAVQFYTSPDSVTWTSLPTYNGFIDKTEAHDAVASAKWVTDISPSGGLPAGTNYVKMAITSTTGSASKPYLFNMNVVQSGIYEAESMAETTSAGTTLTTTSNNKASGAGFGYYQVLSSTAVGNYVEYTLPNVPAGTYSVLIRYEANSGSGEEQLTVDGANVGSVVDEYFHQATWVETARGTVTFATAGSHKVRLTVTGKNASSTGYVLQPDRIVLDAQ